MTKERGIRSAKWLRWLFLSSLVFASWAFWASRQTAEGESAKTYATAEVSNIPRDQRCQANRDGNVDRKDVSLISVFWHGFPEPLADCNSDGNVDVRDAGILINRWTATSTEDQWQAPSAVGRQTAFSIAYDKAPGSWQPGDHVLALVRLSSGEKVSAAEVTLTYPVEGLSVVHAQTAPTAMPVWFARPDLRQAGVVAFAVGKPKGFVGSGTLLALDLAILDPAKARVDFGLGTSAVSYEAEGTRMDAALREQPETASEEEVAAFRRVDMTPPEETKVYTYLLRSSVGERYVVTLDGEDTGSGIAERVVEEQGIRTVLLSDAYVLRSVQAGEKKLTVLTRDAFGNVRETAVTMYLP